jgi:hypothetical protein
MTKVHGVLGEEDAETFLVSFLLPNNVTFARLRVTKGKIRGADALIGMDVIGVGDFSVTNCDGHTIFSYRHPSIKHIDYVAQAQTIRALKQHAGVSLGAGRGRDARPKKKGKNR